MKKSLKIVGLIIAGLLIYYLINHFHHYGIKKSINTGIEGLEENKPGTAISVISPNYRDRYGNDYDSMTSMAKQFLEQFKSVNIVMSNLKISEEGENASAEFNYKVVGEYLGSRGFVAGSAFSEAAGKAYFEKIGDSWLISRLESNHIQEGTDLYSEQK